MNNVNPIPYDLECGACHVKYKGSNPYRELCPACLDCWIDNDMKSNKTTEK